jgi:hypothetical protein
MFNVLLPLSAVLVCAGALSAQQPAPAPDVPPVVATPVGVAVSTDKKTYTPKETIKLTLTAKNSTNLPVKLTFNSGMKYDFEICKGKTSSGDKVWQWSRGHAFFQMVTYATLQPGKTLVYSETFTPAVTGPDGKPVAELAPGTYTATATLALMGRAPRPRSSITFTVK